MISIWLLFTLVCFLVMVHLAYFLFDLSILFKISKVYHGQMNHKIYHAVLYGLMQKRNFRVDYTLLNIIKMYKKIQITVPLKDSNQQKSELKGFRPFYLQAENIKKIEIQNLQGQFPHRLPLPQGFEKYPILLSGYPESLFPKILSPEMLKWALEFDDFRLIVEPKSIQIQLFDLRIRKKALLMILKELAPYTEKMEKI